MSEVYSSAAKVFYMHIQRIIQELGYSSHETAVYLASLALGAIKMPNPRTEESEFGKGKKGMYICRRCRFLLLFEGVASQF